MPSLVLLNGPPAAGKSTVARLLVRSHPLALNLDVDIVRSLLGAWPDDPEGAGLAARGLALAMAERHLTAGLDVVVPQFLARVEFIDQLAAVAAACSASFAELVLLPSREHAIKAFANRSANPTEQTHRDAAQLVARSSAPEPVGSRYDRLTSFLAERPTARVVEPIGGDPEATVGAVVSALLDVGISW